MEKVALNHNHGTDTIPSVTRTPSEQDHLFLAMDILGETDWPNQ